MSGFSRIDEDGILVETEALKLLVQPRNGGRIESLTSKATGREFFWQDPRAEFSQADYVSHGISGYDECLPTISECEYPDAPFRGQRLGDHGSVWNQEWEARIEEDRVVTSVIASTLPLRLERTLSCPEPNRVHLDYAISNLSDAPLKFIWSAHPCLAVERDSLIVLPDSVTEVRPYIPGPLAVEDGKVGWPEVRLQDGSVLRLDTGFDISRGFHTKLFATFANEGWCELRHPSGESLRFEVPVDKVPYCGVWINQGGLIFDKSNPSCIVALEPCTGINDEVPIAEAMGGCSSLNAGEVLEFGLEMVVSS